MGKGDLGEHSRKTRNEGGDDEGPFKKARYVWQLKGKYHLKGKINTVPTSSHSNLNKPIKTNASDSDSEDEAIIGNNNNATVTNNNICSERCCIDDLLTHSSALMEDDESDQELSTNDIEKSISDEIPVTLVKPNVKNHDEYLHKWQARQVAKSFVDNTINSILEHWKIAPFDATDFVENCENSEQVEDDGILMAIQSHGLQTGLRYSAPNSIFQEPEAAAYSADEFDGQANRSALDNLENTNAEHRSKSEEIDDPMDFLNAAVSVAIQKKGLSSYSYG